VTLWDIIRRRGAPRRSIPEGASLPASASKDVTTGSSTILGGLSGIAAGPMMPPYHPRIPQQVPHIQPLGRPAWWWAALPQSRLLYPDDQQNLLLEEMRRTVPILDRALHTLVELCGQVEFEGAERVKAETERWWKTVKVNQTMRGGQTFIESHLDMMLLYGKGVGEIVPAQGYRDVYALMNLDPRSIVFQVTDDPLFLLPLQRQHTNAFLQQLNPETVLVSTNGAHTDTPHGYSLFRSLPHVAQAARVIENATMQTWQRMGCPPLHINWEPMDATFKDPNGTFAAAVIAALKAGWNSAMAGRASLTKGSGNTAADYFTTGRVKVEVIGHDHTPLPLAETWRVFEEQLVAATGLPSWLLGFHWATTERMALQQSEVLMANIEAIRRHCQPQLDQLVDMRQRFAGKSGKVRACWSKIMVHDLVEQARGRAYNSQARAAEIANAAAMWQLGLWDQTHALSALEPDQEAPANVLDAPPPPIALQSTGHPPAVSVTPAGGSPL
jgi:hypothetical protein